jgi:hypothetical protein
LSCTFTASSCGRVELLTKRRGRETDLEETRLLCLELGRFHLGSFVLLDDPSMQSQRVVCIEQGKGGSISCDLSIGARERMR